MRGQRGRAAALEGESKPFAERKTGVDGAGGVLKSRVSATVAGEAWHPCEGRLHGSVVEPRQGLFGANTP